MNESLCLFREFRMNFMCESLSFVLKQNNISTVCNKRNKSLRNRHELLQVLRISYETILRTMDGF